ncbi:MAG: hypothetical protein LUC17_00665 [Oscillospiraceae bacterium]|nr:hypothetical protein [Oscillospiraceae bacterium]
MTLKDLLKTMDSRLLVRVEWMSEPIVTVRAGSWMYLDDALLSVEVAAIEGAQSMPMRDDGAVIIRLKSDIPVYVKTADELQAMMDNSSINCIALAADITADDDQGILCVENLGEKTLDLNGYMLAATNGDCEYVSAITVYGILNIIDTAGGGEVYGGKYASDTANCIESKSGAIVNIYGGHYAINDLAEASVSNVYANGGIVNIYGGYFENQAMGTGDNSVLKSEDGMIVCYGGIYVGQDPAEFTPCGKQVIASNRNYSKFYRVVGK